MYCPRCSNKAVEGQQFCRNCGLNLSVILDSIEGKRGPLDFETLKRDLRDLGANLRSGFEEASGAVKRTKRLEQQGAGQPGSVTLSVPDLSRELKKAARKIKTADARTLSLQKATLSIFGGGTIMAAWYYLLQAVTRPEVVANIERTILQANPGIPDLNLSAYIPLVQLLWLLGLVPIAKGVAHLLNGIFFAPKPDPEPQVIYAHPPPAQGAIPSPPPYVSAVATPTTSEFENASASQQSVIEDATLRFDPK
ncbi:MAG: zinc ribbon domain-containing protein [Blastocatellia bacterium]